MLSLEPLRIGAEKSSAVCGNAFITGGNCAVSYRYLCFRFYWALQTRSAAFAQENLTPQVVFTATDADVTKTYVRLGLGIGIIAHMAWDEGADSDLVALDASHLFEPSVTRLGIRRGTFIRSYMYDFIERFALHLNKKQVVEAAQQTTAEERAALFVNIDLPVR